MTQGYKVRAVDKSTGRILTMSRKMLPTAHDARRESQKVRLRFPRARVEILRFSVEVLSA